MVTRSILPPELGDDFSVQAARRHGISHSRLRSADLRAPFPGVRRSADASRDALLAAIDDPYERQREFRVATARDYAPRLHTGHFFSHETAASIWGAPLPLAFSSDSEIADRAELALHVCALGGVALPRAAGVTRHRSRVCMAAMQEHAGLRVSSPATTWAMLGHLSTVDLVAIGDYFCRQWREGRGRVHAGRPPFATIAELREAMDAGRRLGASRLRTALELVREDSWSPRESHVRCILVSNELPEPALNVDLYDDNGRFLGCADLAYPKAKVAIEYYGMLHGPQWAQDVERAASLRAAGWIVIEVTAPLLRRPKDLVARVRAALALNSGSDVRPLSRENRVNIAP
ncbi:hypothetical protein ACFU0W_13660 [Microbacterium keratanolyticum]|uniref:hypothetical protein n=1 Tax=Microbacterium keratanolyticum TaxID=67574 RepID=UPI00363BC239